MAHVLLYKRYRHVLGLFRQGKWQPMFLSNITFRYLFAASRYGSTKLDKFLKNQILAHSAGKVRALVQGGIYGSDYYTVRKRTLWATTSSLSTFLYDEPPLRYRT